MEFRVDRFELFLRPAKQLKPLPAAQTEILNSESLLIEPTSKI